MKYDRHTEHQRTIENELHWMVYHAIEGKTRQLHKDIKRTKKLKIQMIKLESGEYCYEDRFGDKYRLKNVKIEKIE